MGYTKDIIKGVSWIGMLRFITKAVGLLEAIILARILAPAQFGAYGVALLALGVLEVLTETGVNVFLVQEHDIDQYIDSAWCISLVRGIIISLLLIVLAPFIANFFHSSQSLPLLYLISVVPFLRGFINPSVVKFQKELRFGKDFAYRMAIILIDTVIAVVVTYLTRNPIGIVIGFLSGVFVEVILSFLIVTPRPRFAFHRDYLVLLFHRGKWVTAAGFSDYLFENIDNIAVGRLLGTGSLGVYQMAYAFSVIPLSEIGKVFIHVTTPVMVKISAEPERLKRAFVRTIGIVSVLALPAVLLLVFFPQLAVLFLGEKWTTVVTILPVLAVLGYTRALLSTSSALFVGLKRQEYAAFRTIVTIVGMGIVIVPFISRYGIIGAGLAGLLGSLLSVPFTLYFILKIFRGHRSTNSAIQTK